MHFSQDKASTRCRTLSVILFTAAFLFATPLVVLTTMADRAPAPHPIAALQSVPKVVRAGLTETYGKLPLSFAINQGQTDARVKFTARGLDFGLFLTADEAVFALRSGPDTDATLTGETSPEEAVKRNAQAANTREIVRLKLLGANRKAKVSGFDELPGKLNYFIGNDSRKWRQNVSTYSQVRYRNAYPGIDLVYHGNQQQLEYDFLIAPGASPRRIRMAYAGVHRAVIDGDGSLVLSTTAGDIRQPRPSAYQDFNGERREVGVNYKLDGKQVTFEIGAYDKNQRLVIDPVFAYSSFLGGTDSEQGLGIAVDAQGSAYVTGSTFSTNFPLSGAFQVALSGTSDAFVVKMNPAGTALIYATYLGGNSSDSGNAIAVDAQGSAYVVGSTFSSTFPVTVGAFQDTKDGSRDAFATKLSPDGASLTYSTYLGGDNVDIAYGVAVDSGGRAYLVGSTDSTRLRTLAFPAARHGSPAYKSSDGAGSWSSIGSGLNPSIVNGLAIDPGNSNTIYAATSFGVYKSVDAGTNWNLTAAGNPAIATQFIYSVAVDPSNSSIVYAGTALGLYKSTDGGTTYAQKTNGIGNFGVRSLAIDPNTPTTVYAGMQVGILYKSVDGGEHWVQMRSGISSGPRVLEVVIDPTNTAVVYLGTSSGMYKTTNGGATWTSINSGMSSSPSINSVAMDPIHPTTLYAGANLPLQAVYKTTNGGATWTSSAVGLTFPPLKALAVDPVTPTTIFAATSNAGIFKSTDAGANWVQNNTNLANSIVNDVVVDRNNPATVYVATSTGADVFAVRLNSSASAVEYLANFGGTEDDEPQGVALEADGSAYVVGFTDSQNFPVLNAFQSVKGGFRDAFVTKLNSSGVPVYSTYLGGSEFDLGHAIAVRAGSAYVTGETYSSNFPVLNPIQPAPFNFDGDAFVTKLNPSGASLDFSTTLGGTSFDLGFGLALDANGSVYVTGGTSSGDFPIVAAAQPSPGGAFVSKLNAAGSALVYSTYLGGSSGDQGNGIAVDAGGNTYITGTTFSTNFPTTVGAFQSTLKGGSDAFVTKIGSSFELGVTMTDAPDPVALGSDLTYTINVRNNGDLPTTGVMLSDTLPSGATLVSVNTTRGTCSGTTAITCSLGTMNAAEEATVLIVIKPPAVSSISNTATVTQNEVDPLPANNTATVQTQVDFADLSITGTTASSRVAPNGRINYLFTVKNLSGKTTGSVTVTDNLPAGTTFVSCSAQGGVCGGSGNNRTVTFTSLAVGQSAAIVLVATVNSPVAENTILNNTATVSSTTPDPDSVNNSATVMVTVTTTPLLKKLNGLIAFATGRIFTVKADGSETPNLFPGLPSGILPRWSPDGTKLAFTIAKTRPVYPFDTITEIDVINAGGTGQMTLADNSVDTSFNNRSQFAWSPDGTRVAYIGADKTIYLANADGSGYVKLPNSPSQLRDLDWSADGSRFVFSKDFGEIYVMNVDGSGLTKLVALGTGPDGPTHYLEPTWSPDMTRILYAQVSNNNSDVFIMNSDGTGQQRLLNHDFTTAPAWSPDGTRVAFYNGTEIYVIDLDGTDELRLATNQDCCGFGSISWQPITTTTPLPPPGPAAATFTISGHISNTNGTGGGGILRLSGTRAGTIGADAAGDYTIVNLPQGGTYTITPSYFFYKYDPPTRTFTNLQQNKTGVNFVATSVSYTIKGRLTDTQGQGLGGQPVGLFRFGTRQDTTTDGQGFYTFNSIFPGDGYQVIPLSTSYTFDPVASFPQAVFSDLTINFVGALNESVRFISGRIVDSSSRSLAGQIVTLTGTRRGVLKTNVDGQFSFAGLPAGQNYVLTPSTAGGFNFSPSSATFNIMTFSQNLGITAATSQPPVQFAAPSYTVSESGRAVDITVTRTGELSASGSVDYQTSDVTASERTDYTASYGTLRFAPGEGSRTFSVLVSDDVFVEGARTFTVNLANGAGVAVGSPAPSTTVIITDDDTTASQQNPVDDAAFFVRQHYADFLNRVPDDSGLNFWTDQITSCGADAACRELRRINVSAAFFLSIEFQETGYLVYRIHGAGFGTAERLKIKAFLRDTQEIGRGVVVGVGNWQQQLEANKRAFVDDFVLRSEFTAVYPLSMAPAQFVDMLNANTGGSLLTAERDALVSDLSSGAKTRGEVLRAVAENAEFSRRQNNRAFVLMQYFGYLRRNPDDPPDADFGGHAFWLGKLDQFGGNFIQADMVKSFLVAGEYRGRFGQ